MNSHEVASRGVDDAALTLTVTQSVLANILIKIGCLGAECGGPFGGNGEGKQVTHFHFDETSDTSAATYSPDYKALNHIFKHDWNPRGIRLQGIVHSHPGRFCQPSRGDEIYAERILGAINDMKVLWLPIVNTIPDTGEFRLIPWAVIPAGKGVSVIRGKIRVVRDSAHSPKSALGAMMEGIVAFDTPLEEIVVGLAGKTATASLDQRDRRADRPGGKSTPERKDSRELTTVQPRPDWKALAWYDPDKTFDRVKTAYDLDLMSKSRIIAVGTGGAAGWLEDLARAGLGQFILIDPDIVSETNLATQQTYRRDIGRFKVDCIAARLRDINPRITIIAIQKKLDALSDDALRRLATTRINGRETRRTVLCGLTDSFRAQARVNRLALNFGLPSLSAQVYQEGRGGEITFTYPGVTPACHRCILSSRYRYYLEEGGRNTVTSHGTPIFATTRLNAIKGYIFMAMLHHGTSHPRWGTLLSRIGKRNLIQVRLDPDFSKTLGIGVFDRVFDRADSGRIFFDDSVWLPQDPECPETGHPHCPDCGGTGDLRTAIGKIKDSRLLP